MHLVWGAKVARESTTRVTLHPYLRGMSDIPRGAYTIYAWYAVRNKALINNSVVFVVARARNIITLTSRLHRTLG